MFKRLLEYFTKQFIKDVGRRPQTTQELMSIQNEVVRYINLTKGKGITGSVRTSTGDVNPISDPSQGFTPRVIEGGKGKEGIEKIDIGEVIPKETPLTKDKFFRIKQGLSTQIKLNTLPQNKQLAKEFVTRKNAEFNSMDRKSQIEILERLEISIKNEQSSFATPVKPEDMASGGIARVGMVVGGSVWKKFIEQLFMKSSNNIRLGKGKWKGLTQDQWIKQHDDLTKMLKKWEMGGKKGLPEGAEQFIGMNDLQVTKAIKDATSEVEINKVLNKAYDEVAGGSGFSDDYKMAADQLSDSIAEQLGKNFEDLSQTQQMQIQNIALKRTTQDLKKRLSQPTKTLEGIKKEGTIDISNPEVADEFSRFMRESDPKGYKDLEQKIQLSDFDVKGKKGHASGGIAGQLHLNRPGYSNGKV